MIKSFQQTAIQQCDELVSEQFLHIATRRLFRMTLPKVFNERATRGLSSVERVVANVHSCSACDAAESGDALTEVLERGSSARPGSGLP